MSFTITINTNNQNFAPAGRIFSFTATRSGGSAWTNASSLTTPLSVAGITGALILDMTTTGGNSCAGYCYAGHAGGTLTFTDTVNGGTQTVSVLAKNALNPFTGKTVYVKGGLKNPSLSLLTLVGSPGSTQYSYQVVAINTNGSGGTGKTIGSILANIGPSVYGNLAQSAASMQGRTYVGSRLLTINKAPDAMDGSNYVKIDWNAIAGATGYDLVRSPDGGLNWYTLASNTSAITYNDQNSDAGLALPVYTMPTANTTALGLDTNTGLTSGSPVATLNKAISLCSAGDRIVDVGLSAGVGSCVVDTTQVTLPASVNILGVTTHSTEFNNELNLVAGTSTTARTPYVLPANADISDCTFFADNYGQRILGWGTSDTATTGCNLFRVNVAGFTNAIGVNAVGASFSAEDCFENSLHGSIGLLNTGCVVNIARTDAFVAGSVLTSGTATVAVNLTGGYLCMRDGSAFAIKDSQDSPSWQANAVQSTPTTKRRGAVFINCKIFGATTDFLLASTNLVGIWLMNTDYDLTKNPTLAALPPVVSSPGTYLADPIILGVGGNAAATGGNFRSSQSAVTSGGIFSETRT